MTTQAKRSRDSAQSKQALLDAARYLFNKKGFERSTIRAIGELARVDPALIARYYGSKGGLYAAVLAAEPGEDVAPNDDLDDATEQVRALITRLLLRADEHGPGPILRSLISLDTSDDIRNVARANLAEKLVEPLTSALFTGDDGGQSLRVELAVSALMGVTLGRSLGWFDEMQSAPIDEIVDLVTGVVSRFTDEPSRAHRPSGAVQ